MFARQEKEIEGFKRQEELLNIFNQSLMRECFDTDDRVFVEQKLREVQQQRSTLEQNLAKNREIYMTKVRKVEQQLQQREECLTKCDTVFQTFPELLTFFAAKQKLLREEVEAITTELQNI
jgi:hypothetical protein